MQAIVAIVAASSVGAHLLNGLKPWCGSRVFPHGAGRQSAYRQRPSWWWLTCPTLTKNERSEAHLQLLHDLALRDS